MVLNRRESDLAIAISSRFSKTPIVAAQRNLFHWQCDRELLNSFKIDAESCKVPSVELFTPIFH
ncbi:hypothetical protein [Nostoc sp. T09]|uniref:hypothetical protein n=1 Tax=Nostoc sp. T09 TaxID=1932621 RepID=UPI00117BF26A|nr:hypothetical protein [Nostoc sp. T09]